MASSKPGKALAPPRIIDPQRPIAIPARCQVLICAALFALPAIAGAAPPAQARPTTRLERTLHRLQIKPGEAVRYGAAGLVSGVKVAARTGLRLGRLAGQVAGVGSLGLAVDGGIRLVRARNPEQRVEAVRDLAGGVSGMGRLGWLISPLSVDIGLAGAGLQVGVGAYEVARGICRRDRPTILLGALDLGAGALFGASLLACLNPYTAAGAIVLTVARAAYANRDFLRSTLHRLGERLAERRRARREARLLQSWL